MNALLKSSLALGAVLFGTLAGGGHRRRQPDHPPFRHRGRQAFRRHGKVLSVKSDIQRGDTLSTQDDTYARIKVRRQGPGSRAAAQ